MKAREYAASALTMIQGDPHFHDARYAEEHTVTGKTIPLREMLSVMCQQEHYFLTFQDNGYCNVRDAATDVSLGTVTVHSAFLPTLASLVPPSRNEDPIPVTTYGESITSSSKDGLETWTLLETVNCGIQHEFCGGFLLLHQVTEHHNALVCSNCGLRVVIPDCVETWGDLRQYMADTLKE